MQAGSASTSKFLVWLVVYARGLVVQDLAGTKKRRFSAATRQVKVVVHFSTQFAEKQTLSSKLWRTSACSCRPSSEFRKTVKQFGLLGAMPPAMAKENLSHGPSVPEPRCEVIVG